MPEANPVNTQISMRRVSRGNSQAGNIGRC
jgi:hypothetical protein